MDSAGALCVCNALHVCVRVCVSSIRVNVCVSCSHGSESEQLSRDHNTKPQTASNMCGGLHLLYIICDISSHSEPITAHGKLIFYFDVIKESVTLLYISIIDLSLFLFSATVIFRSSSPLVMKHL